MLPCENGSSSPAASKTSGSNTRAKNPRSSGSRSISTSTRPARPVSIRRTRAALSRLHPEQVRVHLLRRDQVLELLEPRESPAREGGGVEVDPLENPAELLRPGLHVP